MNRNASSTSQGRLQRPADFTGSRLTQFREIFVRHGLPGLSLGLLLLALVPGLAAVGLDAVANLLATPIRYSLIAGLIFAGLVIYSVRRFGRINRLQVGWIVYLGLLSIWEEWVFRVAAPYCLTELGSSGVLAVLVSNALFGIMHFFTLRWRVEWCVMAFLGGLGFSYNFHQQGDLAMIAGIHWVATFLNTPRPPQGKKEDAADDDSEC